MFSLYCHTPLLGGLGGIEVGLPPTFFVSNSWVFLGSQEHFLNKILFLDKYSWGPKTQRKHENISFLDDKSGISKHCKETSFIMSVGRTLLFFLSSQGVSVWANYFWHRSQVWGGGVLQLFVSMVKQNSSKAFRALCLVLLYLHSFIPWVIFGHIYSNSKDNLSFIDLGFHRIVKCNVKFYIYITHTFKQIFISRCWVTIEKKSISPFHSVVRKRTKFYSLLSVTTSIQFDEFAG